MTVLNPLLNAASDGATAAITAVSLHSADPGTTGTSELTGGSPAYARQTPSYGAASGGVAAMSGDLTFDVPAGSTVAWVGFWAGATFAGKVDVTDEAYGAQGTYIVDSATSPFTTTSA